MQMETTLNNCKFKECRLFYKKKIFNANPLGLAEKLSKVAGRREVWKKSV